MIYGFWKGTLCASLTLPGSPGVRLRFTFTVYGCQEVPRPDGLRLRLPDLKNIQQTKSIILINMALLIDYIN